MDGRIIVFLLRYRTAMPKINRTKLLEYLENEFAEELELSHILRCCEAQGYETHKIKKSRKTAKGRK